MVSVLDELGLTGLVTSIDGLSPVGAAAILAQTGEQNRLTPTQARTAVAAAILRQLYAVVTQQQAWDPVIAAHGTTTWKETTDTAAA